MWMKNDRSLKKWRPGVCELGTSWGVADAQGALDANVALRREFHCVSS